MRQNEQSRADTAPAATATRLEDRLSDKLLLNKQTIPQTSESSSSSSFFSSENTSCSSSSSSRSTLIIHRSHTRTLWTEGDQYQSISQLERMATNAQAAGSTASSSPSSTCKRYQNSPFGLKNHFLTMPALEQHQEENRKERHRRRPRQPLGRAKIYQKGPADSRMSSAAELQVPPSAIGKQSPATGFPSHKDGASGKQRNEDANNDHEDDDLLSTSLPSSCASSSLIESPAWHTSGGHADHLYGHRRRRGGREDVMTAAPPHASSNADATAAIAGRKTSIVPAGDAGLDASRCNSKQQQHAFDMRTTSADECYLFSYPATGANAEATGVDNATTPAPTSGQTSRAEPTTRSTSLTRSLHDRGGGGSAHDAGHEALSGNSKKLRQVYGMAGVKSPTVGGGCDSNSLLVRFSSIMYATFLVILGCILHVSELRQKSMNSSDHIYTSIVALIGIIWLLFLQVDLHRYKRYASKFILIESLFSDRHAHQFDSAAAINEKKVSSNKDKLQSAGHHQALAGDFSNRSTSSSSASLVNGDRLSMNTEVIFKKTAYKMYQQRAAALDNAHHNNRYNHHRPLQHAGGKLYQNNKSPIVSSASSEASANLARGKMEDDFSSSHLLPAYKFLHGKMGANFYLKCGMAAFCFGHVIHEGLRFGQQLYFFGSGNVHCRDLAALVAHLITPLYSFYQLFMMFKYSNLVINRHKILARFGLMHIIGTSVTFWFRTIMEEAFEDFVHKMDYFKAQQENSWPIGKPPNNNQHQLPNLTIASSGPSSNSLQGARSTTSWTMIPNLVALFSGSSSGGGGSHMISSAGGADGATQGGPVLLDGNMSALLALMSSPISNTITPQLVKHLPDSYACAQNTLLTTKSMNALPYLYPFTIEYNLLLAATFLSLYFNIGKIGKPGECCGGAACSRPSSTVAMRAYHGGSRASGLVAGVDRRVLSNSSSGSSGYCTPATPTTNSAAPDRHATNTMFMSHFNHHQQHLNHQHEKEDLGEYKSNFVVNADCHSANKGLFCGFFVLLVTLVTIVIFFVTINKPSHVHLGIKINLIQEATLTGLILIVALVGLRQIIKLDRNPFLKDRVTTDDVLMLIPLPFFFIHSLLSFRAETASLYASSSPSSANSISTVMSLQRDATGGTRHLPLVARASSSHTSGLPTSHKLNQTFFNNFQNGTHHRQAGATIAAASATGADYFKLLTVALNLAVMVEVLVQTNFIIDGLRRCSESRYLRFKKPGRELITFAILLNITYWIVATFETKSVEQYKTEIEYYGPLPYMFISHTTLPVMLFYRYHSSVCLAEIWNRAYKPPKKP